MKKTLEKLETVLILVALVSLWPLLIEYRALWYRGWLIVVLAMMVWVAIRRLGRTRAAAEEAKRKRDEMEKMQGRPPFLSG
ncbi:MAG: hypothetical protein JXA57_09175 [Armatimonadetes bacterium]|nr:hypothetical protein [Armatimonadota bacterium]